jgi:hypothetical protein
VVPVDDLDGIRKMVEEMRAVDMSGWAADISYDECLALCAELGLVETLQHGEHEYARVTQNGINVMNALMRLAIYASDPNNKLRQT